MGYTAHLESGNRNIPQQIHDINTDKGTPAHGPLQVIQPTYERGARKAGIDLSQYPSVTTAPVSVQIAAASQIPFREWGTKNKVMAKFPWINPNMTLGDIQKEYYRRTGQGIPVMGTATASAVSDFLESLHSVWLNDAMNLIGGQIFQHLARAAWPAHFELLHGLELA